MSATTVRKNRESTLKGVHWWREVGWHRIITILMIIYCPVPLLCVLSVSLNPSATLTGSNKLSSGVSSENFAALSSGQYSAYWPWVLNSLIVSSVTAVNTALMDAAAAYALNRFHLKGCRTTLTGLLLVQMLPQVLAFVALLLLLLDIEDTFLVLGLGSKLDLIYVYLGSTLGSNIFLLCGFFSSIPRSPDEAAMIGDVTHAQTFWVIITPLVHPVLVVVGLLSFISSLGGFVTTHAVLQSPQQLMLTVGIHNWAADVRTTPWGIFAVDSVIAVVSVILLFQYLRKYIVSGLTADDIKE